MLRTVKVRYEDGTEIVTSISAKVSDEDIRDYYKVGTPFNVGVVDDKIVRVAGVEILD